MDLTGNARMAEYYERFIELQEKLRKSEGERMNLEIKFNEMMQKSRDEEQVYYRRLRSQYKKFLEEDKKRQERNEKIIRTLERIETRIDMLTTKSERVKGLRRHYESYLRRFSGLQEPKRTDTSRYMSQKEFPQKPDNIDQPLEGEQQKLNDEKMKILDSYLENISSQRCKDLIEKRKLENAQLEKLDYLKDKLNKGFDSNKAQSIAEDIMNSIYSRHYNKTQDSDLEYPTSVSAKPIAKHSYKNTDPGKSSNASDEEDCIPRYSRPEREGSTVDHVTDTTDTKFANGLNDNNNEEESPKIESDMKLKEKRVFVEDSHELRYVPSDNSIQNFQGGEQVDEESISSVSKILQDADSSDEKNIHQPISTSDKSDLLKKNLQFTKETDDFVEVTNLNRGYITDELVEKEPDLKMTKEDVEEEEESNKTENVEISNKEELSTHNQIIEQISKDNLPEIQTEKLEQKFIENEEQKTFTDEADIEHNGNGQTQPFIQSNDNEQVIECNDTNYDQIPQTVQYNEDGQPTQYDEIDQQVQYDQNGQVIQYDEKGQVLQYDEHGQALQYDENGQLMQPIQYDQDGQAFQYDENGQAFQYDENGQPIYYDQNGQPIQYDENGQPVQYDENGQPVQYDENGQPVQYDENGQPIQYDENGQPIQYDENGQPIQYDENGQRVQYDENGQRVQYDGNGQPIQYDKNGQPMYQYPQYDESGQAIQQYETTDSNNYQYDESRAQMAQSEENKQGETSSNHFGEEILPTENSSQPAEHETELKGDENKPKTNKILEMLDTDTESLQQNISKVSNDSDFTVSS